MSYTPHPEQTPLLEVMIHENACPLDREGIWVSSQSAEHDGQCEDMNFPQIVTRLVDLMIKYNEPMELRLALAEETTAWTKSMFDIHRHRPMAVVGLESINHDMKKLTGSLANDPTHYVHHEHYPIPGSLGIEVTKYTPKASVRARASLPTPQPGA